ncbi:MAG: HlyC/CorC family transporter [Anaerolineae bacterium]|nr:HlyC/CorC family transporter [Gemmatimonadaceae bacterium]
MSDSPIAARLLMVLFLVAANGFFVAAEFGLVATRRSKIAQMVAGGDRGARVVGQALDHLDRYISGTQLGITLASLALGWIGEPALAALIDQIFVYAGMQAPAAATHTGASIFIAFLTITFLHIVFGELAPKSVALVRPEQVSKLVVRPLMIFSRVMSPFIWLLNGAANRFLGLFGVHPASEAGHVHSPEELRFLVLQARDQGSLDATDSAMLSGVFDFHEKRARDIMRPRTDIVAISVNATEEEVRDTVRREGYSRYPVYGESVDDIVGIFLAKDLLIRDHEASFDLRELARTPLYVPHSLPAKRILDDLRKTRGHIAVVLDEYGGTAGMLTVDDLVEEVIGDLSDEYDASSRGRVALETDGVLELLGALSIMDARSDYGLAIPEGEWSTLGGYVFTLIGRLPQVGDRVTFPGGELEVVAIDGRRVAAVRLHRIRTSTT